MMNGSRVKWILFFICFGVGSALFAQPQLKFIENKCQWPEEILFAAQVPGGAISLSKGEFGYTFIDTRPVEEYHQGSHPSEPVIGPDEEWMLPGHRVKAIFLNANLQATPSPFGAFSGYYNYFIGSDASAWSSDVSAFEGVLYNEFYPGIDLKVYSQGDNMKYEFIVAPGADPSHIAWRYEGVDGVLALNGDLVVTAAPFSFIERQPVIYQEKNGERVIISGEFERQSDIMRYCIGEYDPCIPLIIDPVLIFSTYSGSLADNWGSTATPGEKGTLYSAGVTNHGLGGFFPATAGAFQVSYGGFYDIGLLKYDSTGTKLLYASYLGGTGAESPHSLVINSEEELLILGTTGSSNFPTTANAFDRTYNGGVSTNNVIQYQNGSDLFVTKVSRDGRIMLASTLLGGAGNDGLNPTSSALVANYGDQLRGDIITDESDNIYISTVTSSANFPVAGSFGLTYQGGSTDALILHLSNDLSEIKWAAFLGGNAADASHTIKFDPDGNIIVAGGTASADFPATAGSYQATHNGFVDGWIARLKKDGSQILHSTFTGTHAFDQVYFVDLDQAGNIYAYGQTSGPMPVTAGVYKNTNSGQFLQQFDATLSSLLLSTVFGSGRGIPDISPTAFLVNDCNNIYLSGWGGSINNQLGFWQSSTLGLPVTADAFQKTTSGSDFYFIVLTSDATKLLYATYLGGTFSKTHVDGGTSRFDKSGIVYHAVCSGCMALNPLGRSTSDFPTTPGAWSRTNQSANCNNAAFKFDLSLLKARIQTNSVSLKQPGLNRVCIPDKIVFQNFSTGGQTFEWYFGDGQRMVKHDTSKIIYQYLLPGTYKVKLKVVDLGTCIGVDSTFTFITVSMATGMAGPDRTICQGQTTQLSASGGVQYQWQTADNTFTSQQPYPVVTPDKTTRYFVSIQDANNCVRKDTIQVAVVPRVELAFAVKKNYTCEGRPALQVEKLSEEEGHIFFDFGDGTTSDLPEVVHHYENDGVYVVRLVGTRESCVFDVTERVAIHSLFIPNVITPDEYPENNAFKIIYGKQTISQSDLVASLQVYNRWGKRVYESDQYLDDWTAGNVEAGVYFYELVVKDEFTCKGWLHVVK
jgi:hypothetical protein